MEKRKNTEKKYHKNLVALLSFVETMKQQANSKPLQQTCIYSIKTHMSGFFFSITIEMNPPLF